jgi:hypothetical protein
VKRATKTSCLSLEIRLSSPKRFMNTLIARTAGVLSVSALLMACLAGALAQDNGGQGAPPAATGPDTTTQTIENPPLSGLDELRFEPGFGARSYLLPKAQVSEGVDTNAGGNAGSNTTVRNVTRGLGSLTLQKLWKIHPLDLDYVGGVAHYYGVNGKTYQIHSMAAIQRFLWRTGQLALRDSFSYLPEGSFSFSSFGGTGGFSGGGGLGGLGGGVTSGGGIAGGGGGGVFNSGQFGSLGNQPRITNSSIVDITQAFSPRSSVVLSGGYGLTDFVNSPRGYINSQQITGQAGYNYQLSRYDQVAFAYAFQEFHFPRAGSGSLNANVWQVLYGHRISGKLDLSVGGGPQWIHTYSSIQFLIFSIPVNRVFWSGVGHASLMYQMSARTSTTLTYSRYMNPGSGFFAGANTDAIRYALTHALTQRWNVTVDTGYSRNSRLLSTPITIANHAGTYGYWYAGGALRRQLGRYFGAFGSYQYDDINFSSGFCTTGNPNCSRQYGRHIGLIGLDWTPHPIRLD